MKLKILLALSMLVLAGCNPLLIFPGGELDGTISTTPQNWSEAANIKTVQLETRPNDPYSVNIWAIGIGSILYVHAGENRATWVEHMEGDPNVRIRIGEKLYALRATRTTDQSEFDAFSNAYEKKYDRRPRNENAKQAYLFRLEAKG